MTRAQHGATLRKEFQAEGPTSSGSHLRTSCRVCRAGRTGRKERRRKKARPTPNSPYRLISNPPRPGSQAAPKLPTQFHPRPSALLPPTELRVIPRRTKRGPPGRGADSQVRCPWRAEPLGSADPLAAGSGRAPGAAPLGGPRSAPSAPPPRRSPPPAGRRGGDLKTPALSG